MKKLAIALTCLALATCLLSGALALDLDFKVPTLSDMLTVHRVFMTIDQGSYAVFQIVYYTDSTHELTDLKVITRFAKDSGVKLSDISGLSPREMDEYYPGYSDMSFASCETYEVDGFVDMAVKYSNLNKTENKQKLNQYGLLILTDPSATLSADDYIDYLLKSGDVQEVPQVNYGDLGFRF